MSSSNLKKKKKFKTPPWVRYPKQFDAFRIPLALAVPSTSQSVLAKDLDNATKSKRKKRKKFTI